MIKLFASSIICLISIFAFGSQGNDCAIPFDSTSNKYTYTEVVKLDSSSEFIYGNAKSWLFDKYLNKDFTLDISNEKIIQKGSFDVVSNIEAGKGYTIPQNHTVIFDIILEFKNGRYKYSLTNIKLKGNSEEGETEQSLSNFFKSGEEMEAANKYISKHFQSYYEETCIAVHEGFEAFITEMKNGISSVQSADDDW